MLDDALAEAREAGSSTYTREAGADGVAVDRVGVAGIVVE